MKIMNFKLNLIDKNYIILEIRVIIKKIIMKYKKKPLFKFLCTNEFYLIFLKKLKKTYLCFLFNLY